MSITLDLIKGSTVGKPGHVATPTTWSAPAVETPAHQHQPGETHRPLVTPRMPTDRQMTFMKSLLAELAECNQSLATTKRAELNGLYAQGQLTRSRMSDEIGGMIELLKSERAIYRTQQIQQVAVVEPQFTVPQGHYAVETEDGHLGFYQVSISRKGRYTVSVQASSDTHRLSWSTAKAILTKIEKIGPKAAMARYGREIGECGACGRTLTDEVSRSIGLGPICRNK